MFEGDYIMKNWTDEYLDEKLELTRVWKTMDNGYEIQELKPDRIDEVIKLIKVKNNGLNTYSNLYFRLNRYI